MGYRIKAGEKTYEYGFEHVYKGNAPISTRCSIAQVAGKGIVPVAVAYSKIAHNDQFSRVKGRRIALQKALSQVWPQTHVKYDSINGRKLELAPKKNRTIRALFWKSYFKLVEKPQ
jgi:hypothetical protein